MKTWILVEQNNWREETAPGCFQRSDKAPPSLEAAHDWPGTRVVESETAPKSWGCSTYLANADGSLAYVGNDWDSSG